MKSIKELLNLSDDARTKLDMILMWLLVIVPIYYPVAIFNILIGATIFRIFFETFLIFGTGTILYSWALYQFSSGRYYIEDEEQGEEEGE